MHTKHHESERKSELQNATPKSWMINSSQSLKESQVGLIGDFNCILTNYCIKTVKND